MAHGPSRAAPRAASAPLTTPLLRQLPSLYLGVVVAPVAAQALLAAGPWNVLGVPAALTLLTLAGVTLLSLTRRLGCRAILAATLGVAVALLVLSGALAAALAAAAITLVAFACGAAILRRIGAPGLPLSERYLYAVAIGLGVTSYATFALALTGLLLPWAAAIGLTAAAATGRDELRQLVGAVRRHAPAPPSGAAGPLLAAGCVWAVVLLVEAVAPEVQYDSLSYHLGLPRVWIDAGRLVDIPEQIQSYYYLGAEMNFTLAMLFAGPIAAKLLSFVYFALAVAAVYVVGRQLFSARAAAVGAALFATTPAIAWQGTTTYVDVVVTLYVLLGAMAALRAGRSESTRLAIVAGTLLGLAIVTKVTGALTVAPIAVIAAGRALRGDPTRERGIAGLIAFTVAAAIIVAPWPLLRYLQTGNPAFPLFNALFRSPLWPAMDVLSAPSFALDRFGVGKDPAGLLGTPFALSYMAELFDNGAFGAGFGVALLLLPLALIHRGRSVEVRYLTFISLASLAVWAVSVPYARYVMPVFASLSVLAGVGLTDLASSADRLTARIAAAIPSVLMVASFPLILFLYPLASGRIPYGVAFGAETAEAYLTRTLPSYAPLRQLAASGGRDTYVLLLSFHAGSADDEDRLYAPGRVETISSLWTQEIARVRDPDLALAALRDRGITHIYVNWRLVPHPVRDAAVLQRAFLERVAVREYQADAVEMFRVR